MRWAVATTQACSETERLPVSERGLWCIAEGKARETPQVHRVWGRALLICRPVSCPWGPGEVGPRSAGLGGSGEGPQETKGPGLGWGPSSATPGPRQQEATWPYLGSSGGCGVLHGHGPLQPTGWGSVSPSHPVVAGAQLDRGGWRAPAHHQASVTATELGWCL